MSYRLFFVLLGCLALAACGGDSDPSGGADGGGGGGDAGGGNADAAPEGSFSVTWGPIDVEPGVEDTRCVIKKLGNSGQLRVGSIHNFLGDVSHHFIVYRVADQAERTEPFACQPFSDTLNPANGAPLMITQRYEETLTLPDGVAFTLEPNQTIRLELHYINASDSTKTVQATSTVIPIAEGDFTDEADFLFIGNPDIDLPPGPNTLGPTYFPLPSSLEGSNFFAITGHEHQWGTDVSVQVTDGPSGTDNPVYELTNFNWDEPETVFHDPPFQVPTGGGFRFTCEWDNQSGTNVSFGEGANDEMCFFWAYYYPSKGAKVCVHTAQLGGNDICCPDSPVCDFLF
jgi:hypothetical protein